MRQWKKGQSLVEFALILPLLLIVLLSLIDGALLVQGYLTVHHAAREAARWAIAYQPPQGDCWDANGNGTITDEPWPYCPVPGYQTNAYETDDEYHLRRVQLIKMRGVEATLGLRTEVVCDGVPTDPSSVDSSGCISTTLESEGMLGVQVWGMRAFQDDGTGVPLNLEDHPGLQGLPVQVRVTHNVPLVIFAPLLRRPFVRVSSTAEMINEGVQVGYGNQPPPTLPPPPPINPPGTPPPTVTPQATPTGGPSPTPTPLPVYTIALNFETATNQLPDEREHLVIATVRDPLGQAVSGAQVTFRTSGGSFDYSGIGNTSATRYTGVDGAARIFAYTNRPRAAAIEAWLDYNGDGDIDADEPYDDAVKIWEATGPYLVVSDYNPEPLYWLAIDLMDHPFDDNPYSLWWCPISGTVITEQMAFPVDVAIDTWDAEGIAVQVPEGVTGFYRIESHIGDGGGNACGAGTLVAYSSPIQIADLPPDLIISHMEIDPAVVASGVAPGRPITIIMEIQNLEPVPVTGGPFDIDIYMDLEFSPTVGMLGAAKQWVLTLGPSESAIITDTIIFETMGEHTVWA
ncbi:MAG: Ig-like domain-containing protein, partial [Anaerolineae bacterium]|nr:Ig-like domain-containing protein [Anaerolineae bacterium]